MIEWAKKPAHATVPLNILKADVKLFLTMRTIHKFYLKKERL